MIEVRKAVGDTLEYHKVASCLPSLKFLSSIAVSMSYRCMTSSKLNSPIRHSNLWLIQSHSKLSFLFPLRSPMSSNTKIRLKIVLLTVELTTTRNSTPTYFSAIEHSKRCVKYPKKMSSARCVFKQYT